MADFMRNEPFGPAMLLDRRCRARPESKKKEQKKKKCFVILQEKYTTFPYGFKLSGHYLTKLNKKSHIFVEYLPMAMKDGYLERLRFCSIIPA